MIYRCSNDTCRTLWSLHPTARKAVRAPLQVCPDCKRGDRRPRSRRRGGGGK